jgi:UDP-4-amino-4,6-dideoxy-N-acetyl-beta-L-altrosamine N-acetyltransferase
MSAAIQLRDVRPEDRDLLLKWRNLEQVAKYMYTDHQITPEEHADWFAAMASDPRRKYWMVLIDDTPVGVVNLAGIDPRHKRCYWGFYLGDVDVRGRGVGGYVECWIMRYVFETLGFNKLCGEVLAWNEKVIEMHQTFGFRVEGLLRQHVIKGSESVDVVSIGILRSEWEARRAEFDARLRQNGG